MVLLLIDKSRAKLKTIRCYNTKKLKFEKAPTEFDFRVRLINEDLFYADSLPKDTFVVEEFSGLFRFKNRIFFITKKRIASFDEFRQK
jgi:hypothetical protein